MPVNRSYAVFTTLGRAATVYRSALRPRSADRALECPCACAEPSPSSPPSPWPCPLRRSPRPWARARPPVRRCPPMCSSPEYIEGSSFNKAVEIFNGTGAPVDLAAGGYVLELYSNGSPTVSQSVALTGHGGRRRRVRGGAPTADGHPGPGRSDLHHGRQLERRRRRGAAQGRAAGPIVDVIGAGRRRPGRTVGHRRRQHRRQHHPPQGHGQRRRHQRGRRLRSRHRVGRLPRRHVRRLRRAHLRPRHRQPADHRHLRRTLSTVAGTAANRVVTATDPDGTVVDVDVTDVSPAPAAGTITRTAFTPRAGLGGTAEADHHRRRRRAGGSYAVTVTATNDDATAQTATCTHYRSASQGIPPSSGAGPGDRHHRRRHLRVAARGPAGVRARRRHAEDAGPQPGRQPAVRHLPAEPAGHRRRRSDHVRRHLRVHGRVHQPAAARSAARLRPPGRRRAGAGHVTEFFTLTQLSSPGSSPSGPPASTPTPTWW